MAKENKVAYTNAYTGITTYKDPAATDQTTASQPSTSTSLAPSATSAGKPSSKFTYADAASRAAKAKSLFTADPGSNVYAAQLTPGGFFSMDPNLAFQLTAPGAEGVGSPLNDFIDFNSAIGGRSNPLLSGEGPSAYTGKIYRGPSDTGLRGGQRWGLNPATGQYEPLYSAYSWQPYGAGNYAPSEGYYFASEAPAGGAPSEYDPQGGGTLFDQAVQIGVPIGLGVISGGLVGPALGGGMLGAVGAGTAGAGVGTLSATGDLRKAAEAGAVGGITAGGVGMLSPAIASTTGLPTSFANPAANFAVNYAESGDPRKAGLNAGLGAAATAAAPYVNDFFGVKPKGMLPGLEGPTASQVPGAAPDVFGNTGAPTDLAGVQTGSAVPTQFNGTLAGLMNSAGLDNRATDKYITPGQQAANAQTAGTIDKLAKLGAAFTQMGRATPAGAPQRAAGQSDAQYGQSLVQYAQSIGAGAGPGATGGFNAAALNGLTPGTPQYYQAVMGQMDSIINRLAGSLDLNAADLSAQLRGKSAKELDDLQRALYVRGQLGTLMGSGQYTDPFSGRSENVQTGGMRVNPGLAAYHRGLASSAENLAGLDPTAARSSVEALLARNPDLYGMQAAANQRMIDEILAAQGYPTKKRGMLPDSGDPLMSLLGVA